MNFFDILYKSMISKIMKTPNASSFFWEIQILILKQHPSFDECNGFFFQLWLFRF